MSSSQFWLAILEYFCKYEELLGTINLGEILRA